MADAADPAAEMRSFLYAILAALIVLMVIVTKLVERGAEQSGGVEDGELALSKSTSPECTPLPA